jgi:hypothetical protein
MNKNDGFYDDLVDGNNFDNLLQKRNKSIYIKIHVKIMDFIYSDFTESDREYLENYFGETENELIDNLTNDDLIITVSELIQLIKRYINDYELSQIICNCYNSWTYFEIIKK